MIADGAGFQHFQAACLYQNGTDSSQSYSRFPVNIAMSTYPYDSGYDPAQAHISEAYLKDKYTDSAASGTAIASGHKTINGTLNLSPSGDTLQTIAEYAETLGKSSGVVTTVPFDHATPAAFAAHNTTRGHYYDIADEMIFKSKLDVIIGAGHPQYDRDGKLREKSKFKYVSETSWNMISTGQAGNNSDTDSAIEYWHFTDNTSELIALAHGKTPERLFGCVKANSTLQQERRGSASEGYNPDDESVKTDNTPPYATPLLQGLPNLCQLCSAAINVLDNDPDGFFLMIEGGAIDWTAHGNQSGRLIEELIDFNDAVNTVIQWVETHGGWNQNLLIITADHETGFLTGPDDPYGENYSLINHGKGQLPGMRWRYGSHTNSLVPLFARGKGQERFQNTVTKVDPVRGKYIDSTDLAKILFAAWGKSIP